MRHFGPKDELFIRFLLLGAFLLLFLLFISIHVNMCILLRGCEDYTNNTHSIPLSGLHFLRHYGPKDELFSVDSTGATCPVPWPAELFPFLVVNIGSGVSVIQVSFYAVQK